MEAPAALKSSAEGPHSQQISTVTMTVFPKVYHRLVRTKLSGDVMNQTNHLLDVMITCETVVRERLVKAYR